MKLGPHVLSKSLTTKPIIVAFEESICSI